jgi:hypothetical protein
VDFHKEEDREGSKARQAKAGRYTRGGRQRKGRQGYTREADRQACKAGINRQEGSKYHGVRQKGKVHREAKAGREKEAYMQKEVGRQKQAMQAGR